MIKHMMLPPAGFVRQQPVRFVRWWPVSAPTTPVIGAYGLVEFTVQHQAYHVIIDQPHPVLASVDQYTRIDFIDDPCDPGTVLRICKRLFLQRRDIGAGRNDQKGVDRYQQCKDFIGKPYPIPTWSLWNIHPKQIQECFISVLNLLCAWPSANITEQTYFTGFL